MDDLTCFGRGSEVWSKQNHRPELILRGKSEFCWKMSGVLCDLGGLSVFAWLTSVTDREFLHLIDSLFPADFKLVFVYDEPISPTKLLARMIRNPQNSAGQKRRFGNWGGKYCIWTSDWWRNLWTKQICRTFWNQNLQVCWPKIYSNKLFELGVFSCCWTRPTVVCNPNSIELGQRLKIILLVSE